MFKKFAALLFLALSLLTSCVKNEFKAEFSLPRDTDRQFRVLYYASDPAKGWFVESMISVEKGKAEMLGVTRNPTLVYVFGGGNFPATFFYARRGETLKITAESADPLEWNISGNDVNEALSAWRKSNLKALKEWRPATGTGVKEVNEAVARYVAKNPENPVSTLLLLEYFDRNSDEEGFVANWKKLRGKALDPQWRELVSRSDMLDDPAPFSLPRQLFISSLEKGADTINFGRVPVLLNFTRGSVNGYDEDVDLLRRLSKNSGDSASRVIANIIIEFDSLQRASTSRHDSLRGVMESWIPLGLTDERLRQLGVRSVPQVIVVGTDRKVKYRGNDLKKAASEFEKLIDTH